VLASIAAAHQRAHLGGPGDHERRGACWRQLADLMHNLRHRSETLAGSPTSGAASSVGLVIHIVVDPAVSAPTCSLTRAAAPMSATPRAFRKLDIGFQATARRSLGPHGRHGGLSTQR
jgi:hypothetical protein